MLGGLSGTGMPYVTGLLEQYGTLFRATIYDVTLFIQNESHFKFYIKLQQLRSGIKPEYS